MFNPLCRVERNSLNAPRCLVLQSDDDLTERPRAQDYVASSEKKDSVAAIRHKRADQASSSKRREFLIAFYARHAAMEKTDGAKEVVLKPHTKRSCSSFLQSYVHNLLKLYAGF
jgi:hypothetical protein